MDQQCSLCAHTGQYSFKMILKGDHAVPVILSSTVTLGWVPKKKQAKKEAEQNVTASSLMLGVTKVSSRSVG